VKVSRLLQADRLSFESRDVTETRKTNAYIKHPYICTMNFGHAAVLLMLNSGRSLGDIMNDLSEAATFRTEWKENAGEIRRIFCRDIGLSSLNLIEATRSAHNDIRLPNVTWNTRSFCLIDFDNCTMQVHGCNILSGIDTNTQVGLMLFTVAQIAMIVWELDCNGSVEEIRSCRSFFLGSDPSPSQWPKFREWLESRPSLKFLFSDFEWEPTIHANLKADIREWTKSDFILVLIDMLQIPAARP
jgi:hypothetical protein